MKYEAQCCVCKRVRYTDKSWSAEPRPHDNNTSHGYCPDCFEAMKNGEVDTASIDRAREQARQALVTHRP